MSPADLFSDLSQLLPVDDSPAERRHSVNPSFLRSPAQPEARCPPSLAGTVAFLSSCTASLYTASPPQTGDGRVAIALRPPGLGMLALGVRRVLLGEAEPLYRVQINANHAPRTCRRGQEKAVRAALPLLLLLVVPSLSLSQSWPRSPLLLLKDIKMAPPGNHAQASAALPAHGRPCRAKC